MDTDPTPRSECNRGMITASPGATRASGGRGFSIGSNDLTQLTLRIDRDSEDLAELFDEQDEAVKWMIESVIRKAQKAGGAGGRGWCPTSSPLSVRTCPPAPGPS